MRFKDLKLEYLANKAKNIGIEVPEPFGSGKDVKNWYEDREYDKIFKHLDLDLRIIRIIDLGYRHIYGVPSTASYNAYTIFL